MAIQHIDVTLRDGGYRNQFHFDIEYAKAHVHGVASCGIEWLEIGYRNGSFKPIEGIGITGLSPNHYIAALREAHLPAKLCVMAHPKNITAQDINHLHQLGISMLRLCLDNQHFELTRTYIQIAKSLNLLISLNLTRISQQSLKQLLICAEFAREAQVDILYLADSNGSLTPARITNLIHMMHEISDVKIGFHAHDNLGLAMSNSIAAINAGATFIDASLRGIGKGAGNLKLELWISYLRKNHHIYHYDHALLLEQAERLEKTNVMPNSVALDDLILGLFDLSIEDKERIIADTHNIGQIFRNAAA